MMVDEIDEEAWQLADKRQRIFRHELARYRSLGFWRRVLWRMTHDIEVFEHVANGPRISSARFIVKHPTYRRMLRNRHDI